MADRDGTPAPAPAGTRASTSSTGSGTSARYSASPGPSTFRRERNLSNRNFAKRGSNARRFSTESHNSAEAAPTPAGSENSRSTTPSSSFHYPYSYSTYSEEESGATALPEDLQPPAMPPPPIPDLSDDDDHDDGDNVGVAEVDIDGADPAAVEDDPDVCLLDVKNKVQRFEQLQAEQRILFKTGKYHTRATPYAAPAPSPPQLPPPIEAPAIGETSLAAKPLVVVKAPPRRRPKSQGSGQARAVAQGGGEAGGGAGGGGEVEAGAAGGGERTPEDVFEAAGAAAIPVSENFRPSPAHAVVSSPMRRPLSDVRSEDDLDSADDASSREYYLPEVAAEAGEEIAPQMSFVWRSAQNDAGLGAVVHELNYDDFGSVETAAVMPAHVPTPPAVKKRIRSPQANTPRAKSDFIETHKDSMESEMVAEAASNGGAISKTDFRRNFSNAPRPKTEILGTKNHQLISQFNSFRIPPEREENEEEEEEEEEIVLRHKHWKLVEPIVAELIDSEERYIDSLVLGLQNYGTIFTRPDLPHGLQGKRYVLLGNVEQLLEFHRDEFLPMLQRNRRDLKQLFDDFQMLIDQNYFYGYVIFTMNKKRSQALCQLQSNYFKLIQNHVGDKLGINSFLVQPIQRMARYPLFIQQFITTLFRNREFVMKPVIESCCRLDKKMRTLLTTTNESEVINDIEECNDFNVFYQGKFRKVGEFMVTDHTLRRGYRAKVFIFDKCLIYAEIKGPRLIYRGRYPYEHIGFTFKTKSFTLFYVRRQQQECDFQSDNAVIDSWKELLRDIVNSFIRDLKALTAYSRDADHLPRKTTSLALYRDSNRFSTDSGIGNIWVLPKPEAEDAAHRTTWYTST